MKIEVEFEIYYGLMGYKEQQKIIILQDGTAITISCSCTMFKIIVEGNDEKRLDNLIYGIWELCCLFDGYFYKPTKYMVDRVVKAPEQLIRLKFYQTDKKWAETGLILRECASLPLSEEIIEKYLSVRHNGRKFVEQKTSESKMTLPLINSFFYIFSASYSEIMLEHRLALLLNVCDGYAINEGKNQNTKDNIISVFTNDNMKEIKQFAKTRYGINIGNFNDMIYGTRIELDHYAFNDKSAGNAIFSNKADGSLNLFLLYFIWTAFRASLLKSLCTDNSAITEIDNEQKRAMNKIMKWSEKVKASQN